MWVLDEYPRDDLGKKLLMSKMKFGIVWNFYFYYIYQKLRVGESNNTMNDNIPYVICFNGLFLVSTTKITTINSQIQTYGSSCLFHSPSF